MEEEGGGKSKWEGPAEITSAVLAIASVVVVIGLVGHNCCTQTGGTPRPRYREVRHVEPDTPYCNCYQTCWADAAYCRTAGLSRVPPRGHGGEVARQPPDCASFATTRPEELCFARCVRRVAAPAMPDDPLRPSERACRTVTERVPVR